MADMHMRLDGDHLVIAITADPQETELHLHTDVSVGDAQELLHMLERSVETIATRRPAAGPDVAKAEAPIRGANGEWIERIVMCACGKNFPKHGLGGLGKHASQCKRAHEIQVRTERATLYTGVLRALKEWAMFGPFTVPEMVKRFERARAPVSYSGVRAHVDYLVDEGYLETRKEGRSRHFYPIAEVQGP